MTEPKNGLYTDIDNQTYHQDTSAVSKTMLDLLHRSPPLLQWYQRAPVDEEAEKAVDLGNAFEAALLEPERYASEYITAPNVDRRTKAGKAEYEAFLEAAAECTVLSHDQARQIGLMVQSAWAHPLVERVLSAAHITQGSYYWIDPVTEIPCKCRPDVLCTDIPIAVDLKTTADMSRFPKSVADFRYHVQDAFYSDGLTHYFDGEHPNFLFIVVSTSRSAGRFPVHVMELGIDDKHQGVNEYRADLERYAEFIKNPDYTNPEEIRLPKWARGEGEL